MRRLSLHALALLACVSCNRAPLGGPSSPDGAVDRDLAAQPDATTAPECLGRAECDCYHAPGCQVLAEACWCPFPQCDPNGACVCGGGKYIGCVPDCTTARSRLMASCNFSESYLAGLSCSTNPTCIAACMAKLERCDEVTCDFCSTCDCGGQMTAFTNCYAACLGG